jgi:sulfite reductase beta subunit-like hemoprotein
LTRLAKVYADKIKWNDVKDVVKTMMSRWKVERDEKNESFGDFATRVFQL